MENSPVLADLIDNAVEFEQLLEKLLVHNGRLNGYVFEPLPRYGGTGILGVVRENYPGMKCPVAFYSIWSKNLLKNDAAFRQVKEAFESLLKSDVKYTSYVLITPHALKNEEKEGLDDLFNSFKIKTDIYHWGPSQIQELLKTYPAVKKYYYSKYGKAENPSQDFVLINKEYKQKLNEVLKYLHFVGLPTGSYQKQQLLKKPELTKIFIPPGFSKSQSDMKKITLPGIMRKSNRVVILGDPGSGKSTLANYLALTYCRPLKKGDKTEIEEKTPFIIPIRELGKKSREKFQSCDFIDYLKSTMEVNYGFNDIDNDFFIALLELGKAIVVFDGLDEVASEESRVQIAKDIEQFSLCYPDAILWVTSRIVGYTGFKILNDQFDLYYLAPVSPTQAKLFIKKWYEIQIPINKTLRAGRIHSLQQAIEENPGVKRLRANPLLLTMMILIHQFEGTLPDNRSRLFEKCIELLLKTWQDQKYSSQGIENPLEKRGLKYNTQLQLLAAVAFNMLKRTLDSKDEMPRSIKEKELEKLLFEQRFDKKRMKEKQARTDVRVFLDYIRDRAGLLMEIGRNEKGENLFSFVHLSFLEYLAAYKIAEDRSKPQEEHILQLVQYLGIPAWWETVLLALHLFSRSTGPSFIDSFTEAVFEKLSVETNPKGWLLMGRAVRDNINFAPGDIKTILREVVNIWLERSEGNLAPQILTEIVLFSGDGKKILREVIKESFENNPVDQAFRALCFYKYYYKIDSSIPGIFSKNKDYARLLAYLPVYRYEKQLKGVIENNLEVSQWFIYFNSASDKTPENLDRLLAGERNSVELRGYILSSWKQIFNTFQDRSRFLEQKKNGIDLSRGGDTIRYHFADYAEVHFPFTVFQPYLNFKLNDTGNSTMTISDQKFISEDRRHYRLLNEKFLEKWVNKTAQDTLEKFENDLSLNSHIRQGDKKFLITRMSQFGIDFFHDFMENLKRNFIRDFIRDIVKEGVSQQQLRHFIRSLHHYLTGDFIQAFLPDFNKRFIKSLKPDITWEFCREFSRYLNFESHRIFIRISLRDRMNYMRQYFKKRIVSLYRKKYNKKMKWQHLSEQDYERLYHHYVDELSEGNIKVADAFFDHLYDYLFIDRFEVSFESRAASNVPQYSSNVQGTAVLPHSLSMVNSVMIPFTFGFLLAADLNHYLIHILANLNSRFHVKDELEPEMISEAVDDYSAKHPFMLYLIHFCWDFYAGDFNEKYQDKENDRLSHLRLTSFIVNAAKVSLTTGRPCKGEYWEKILEEAERISPSSLLVNISLTLYKLCNFRERETNSARLKDLLEKLKIEYPEDYQLLGLTL